MRKPGVSGLSHMRRIRAPAGSCDVLGHEVRRCVDIHPVRSPAPDPSRTEAIARQHHSAPAPGRSRDRSGSRRRGRRRRRPARRVSRAAPPVRLAPERRVAADDIAESIDRGRALDSSRSVPCGLLVSTASGRRCCNAAEARPPCRRRTRVLEQALDRRESRNRRARRACRGRDRRRQRPAHEHGRPLADHRATAASASGAPPSS